MVPKTKQLDLSPRKLKRKVLKKPLLRLKVCDELKVAKSTYKHTYTKLEIGVSARANHSYANAHLVVNRRRRCSEVYVKGSASDRFRYVLDVSRFLV